MSVKMIALDLDGTLTTDSKEVTDHTVEVLRKAAQKGAVIVLASGRPELGIYSVIKRLGLNEVGGYAMAYNGGHIWDCRTGKDVFRKDFPREYLEEAVQFARDHHVAICSYDEEGVVTEGPINKYVEHEGYNNNIPIKLVKDLPAYLSYPFVKLIICEESVNLSRVEKIMAEQFKGRLDVYKAEPIFLEVLSPGIKKSSGLELLMNRLGIDSSELMACGDGNNDLPMLELAGLSVAMGNGSDPVKQTCRFTTKSNNDDGVAYAVEKFVLNGEPLP